MSEVKATQITIGLGLVDVMRIDHEGRSGILFHPRTSHIQVGEDGETQAGEYWPVEGDVVIWIENEDGAAVIDNYLWSFLRRNPVAEIVSKHGDPEAFGERELVATGDIQKFPYGTKLYASPDLTPGRAGAE